MNKKEFTIQIASKTGLTLREAARLIDAFHAVVQEELAGGGKVQLKGFGSFEVYERPAHTGRSPQSGVIRILPATRVVKFKAGKLLKENIVDRAEPHR